MNAANDTPANSQHSRGEISAKTKVYGVMGSPVAHSLSPMLFNFLFHALDMDAIYLPFAHRDVSALLGAARTMNLAGLSVTLPHKQTALAHLDEIDPHARQLNAINTIVRAESGALHGYNTDGPGAIRALTAAFPRWRDNDVLIVGGGGSAAAIALTLAGDVDFHHSVCIATRSEERGSVLLHAVQKRMDERDRAKQHERDEADQATQVDIETSQSQNSAPAWMPLSELQTVPAPSSPTRERLASCRTIIQTTPIGMTQMKRGQENAASQTPPTHSSTLPPVDDPSTLPPVDDPSASSSAMPLRLENFHQETFVYDIIYTPLQTPLLKHAATLGLRTLSGLDMFLEQAMMQFHLFTGIHPPRKLKNEVRARLCERLEHR